MGPLANGGVAARPIGKAQSRHLPGPGLGFLLFFIVIVSTISTISIVIITITSIIYIYT